MTPDTARFAGAPIPVALHIVSAAPYCLLGAFQFSAGFRRRWPAWHRGAGRVVAGLGIVSALSGVWMAARYEESHAAMQGPLLLGVRVIVGLAMAAAIVLAVVAVLRRDFLVHELWMVRAYAMGQGAGLDGETLEHADVRATRVAGRNGADQGPQGTQHDARDLPEQCSGVTAMDRDPEHELPGSTRLGLVGHRTPPAPRSLARFHGETRTPSGPCAHARLGPSQGRAAESCGARDQRRWIWPTALGITASRKRSINRCTAR